MSAPPPQDFADYINDLPGNGFVRLLGLRITSATADEVRAEWTVDERHHQGHGIVHGGVHCSVIESLASIGAHLSVSARGHHAVGLENHTSFIRAVRTGKLTAVARPLTRGRQSQLWEASIHDEAGQLVARGTVRLLVIAADQNLAGAPPATSR